MIYFTTLTFPNDLEFFHEFNSKNDNRHGSTYLQQKFKMPQDVIKFKILEFNKFKTIEILSNNIELRKLTEQNPQFEIKDKHQR